jgi:hypothetical protein
MTSLRLVTALALVGLAGACRQDPLATPAGNGGTGAAGVSAPGDASAGGGGAADAGAGGGGGSAPIAGSGGASQSGGFTGGTQTDLIFELSPARKLDLVFMIDNSSSMQAKQESLALGFPALVNELASLPGGLPDLHIGIISSNFGAGPNKPAPGCPPYGDRGRFLVKPGCGLGANANPWLEADATGKQNFTGALPDVFGCMAKLGVDGCGYEHQLQALRASLYDVNPENRGFLREDATLGIVLVTDEDDCSAEPFATIFDAEVPANEASGFTCSRLGHVCGGQEVPAQDGWSAPLSSCKPYERVQNPALDSSPERDPIRRARLINVSEMVDFIKEKKHGRPDRIVVSAITGWDAAADATYQVKSVTKPGPPPYTLIDNVPICQSPRGSATPAVRLKAFVDAFGDNGSLYSICQDDLADTVKSIGANLSAKMSVVCVPPTLADVDPSQPGQQLDCAVAQRIPSGTDYTEILMPRCIARGPRPCWSVAEAAGCASRARFVIEPGGQPAPLGTLVSLRCRDGSAAPSCSSACPVPGASTFGRACDLGLTTPPGPSVSVWREDAGCASHVCFKSRIAPQVSSSVDTSAVCTSACASDADCAKGETRDPTSAADKRCRRGFTCQVAFEVGPLACQKLCVCRDSVGFGAATVPASCAGR